MLIALDYETSLLDGTPSIEYYRHDFRVVSCAFSWFEGEGIQHLYLEGEDKIREMLQTITNRGDKIVVHNYSFEYGVTRCRFPEITLNFYADTMRLTQNADGGSDLEDDDTIETKDGLSLQACVSRHLPVQYHNHKEPFYEKIRAQGIRKGKEGQNLHLLSPEDYASYNVADTEVTLLLAKVLIDKFQDMKFNWVRDHQLYRFTCEKVSEARIKGIKVDRIKLLQSIEKTKSLINTIYADFRRKYASELLIIEQKTLEEALSTYKTEKGFYNAWERLIENDEYRFNINSTKQLGRLFIDLLGIKPKFFTETGLPAFGKAFLPSYGEGGQMLIERGSLNQGLRQMISLYDLSEYDGRWHLDLKVAAARTGRLAGGSSE